MKVLTTITLRGSHKLLRVGSIRSSAALPRMAVRGRAFLSERPDNNWFCCYKGGLAEGVTHRAVIRGNGSGGLRFANPPYGALSTNRPRHPASARTGERCPASRW